MLPWFGKKGFAGAAFLSQRQSPRGRHVAEPPDEDTGVRRSLGETAVRIARVVRRVFRLNTVGAPAQIKLTIAPQIRTLADLQNLCKRDADAYREEFLQARRVCGVRGSRAQQWRHFEALVAVVAADPAQGSSKAFGDLVAFLCAVAPCYPAHVKSLPGQIIDILTRHRRGGALSCRP